jgi:hypothetical protein
MRLLKSIEILLLRGVSRADLGSRGTLGTSGIWPNPFFRAEMQGTTSAARQISLEVWIMPRLTPYADKASTCAPGYILRDTALRAHIFHHSY